MANRNNTHESISALTAQISEINADLKSRNNLSVLDIDLLRKHTIDLYEEVNRLRLVMKDKVEDKVEVEFKSEEEVKFEAEVEQEALVSEPVEEEKVEVESPVLAQNPEPETPAEPDSEPVEEKMVEVESPALAQNPEPETPVEPVSEPVEEEIPALSSNPEPETPLEEKVLAAEAKVEADAIKSASNEEEANDLAHKFSNTPINDLKKAISIAKKFEFINSLFAGNVEKYAYSIHHMNNLVSGDEAFTYLHDLRSEYKWDDEDKNFLELANLVRRRYLG